MTVPQAIIAAAFLVALSVLGSALLTPYRVSSSTAGVWRINTITGGMELCSIGLGDKRCM